MGPLPYCLCNCAIASATSTVRIRSLFFKSLLVPVPVPVRIRFRLLAMPCTMDTTQDRTRAASLARTLTTALTNPYSTSVPYPHHSPAHHVNPQGYAYSSTYNPLAYSPSHPPTSYSSLGHPFSNASSASASRNSHPRGTPQTHWYTPGNSKCTHSGCTFTGSANSVQIHMMDRHLIYPPRWQARKRQSDWDADPSLKGYVVVHTQSIKNGSLAKLCSSRAHRKPVPILGTNVRLDTPEEIAAWVAERKRRWPTTARVAEKKRKLEEATANGELLPEHLLLTGNKRFRPHPSSDVGLTRTRQGRGGAFFGGSGGRGRGRGAGAGGRNRGHGTNWFRGGITTSAQSRSQSQSQTQPSPLPMAKDTDPRSSAQQRASSIVEVSHLGSSDVDSDSGSDDEAPEVLSAKRPPGIDAYASSSDAELEPPQAVSTHSQPEPANPPSSGDSGLTTTAGPQSTPAKAESINHPRKAPPPQPKRPPRNPFAPRSSLLRNVSSI